MNSIRNLWRSTTGTLRMSVWYNQCWLYCFLAVAAIVFSPNIVLHQFLSPLYVPVSYGVRIRSILHQNAAQRGIVWLSQLLALCLFPLIDDSLPLSAKANTLSWPACMADQASIAI